MWNISWVHPLYYDNSISETHMMLEWGLTCSIFAVGLFEKMAVLLYILQSPHRVVSGILLGMVTFLLYIL